MPGDGRRGRAMPGPAGRLPLPHEISYARPPLRDRPLPSGNASRRHHALHAGDIVPRIPSTPPPFRPRSPPLRPKSPVGAEITLSCRDHRVKRVSPKRKGDLDGGLETFPPPARRRGTHQLGTLRNGTPRHGTPWAVADQYSCTATRTVPRSTFADFRQVSCRMALSIPPMTVVDLSAIVDAFPTTYPIATYAHLRSLGFEQRDIASSVKHGLLHRVRRGVFVPKSYWQDLPPWDQDVVLVKAHHAASHDVGVYSHVSAARLHGLSLWAAPPTIHVVHAGRRGTSAPENSVVRHNQVLPSSEIVRVDGICMTSLERTVVDCGRILSLHSAVIIADSALRRGANASLIHSAVAHGAGTRNILRVRAMANAMDGRSESAGETRVRLLMSDWGVPNPELQYRIWTRIGPVRADFAWPDIMLIVEFDGLWKYLVHQPTQQALLEERAREAALMEEGWHVMRIRWADFTNESALRRRLQGAFVRAQNQVKHAS